MFNFLIILLAISPTVIGAFDATTPENSKLVRNLIERLDPMVAKGQAISLTQVRDIAPELDSCFNPDHTIELFLNIVQHFQAYESTHPTTSFSDS